jgi:hypothetical protein
MGGLLFMPAKSKKEKDKKRQKKAERKRAINALKGSERRRTN